MKKLMIAAAIVCAAAMSQAATVAWGGSIADPGDLSGNTAADPTYKAYLLYSAVEMASIATTLDKTGIGAKADNGGAVVATWDLTDDAANYMFSSTFIRDDADGGVNGWYQMLVVDETGKRFGAANETFVVESIGDKTSAGLIDYNSDTARGFDVFVGDTGWSGKVGAVPEPTSGLLLLLGVAGLALRRRRA